jgi:hypothetical protein
MSEPTLLQQARQRVGMARDSGGASAGQVANLGIAVDCMLTYLEQRHADGSGPARTPRTPGEPRCKVCGHDEDSAPHRYGSDDYVKHEFEAVDAFDLDALQQLCDAAAPGPWSSGKAGVVFNKGGEPVLDALVGFQDAQLAAAARDALPKLIARVRELEQRAQNAERLREYADQRSAILADRLTSPVCRWCHLKRKGTHCADCRGELKIDSDGDYCVEEGPEHA